MGKQRKRYSDRLIPADLTLPAALIELTIIGCASCGVVIAGRAARRAAHDWQRLREQRINGGAVIVARHLVQSERLRAIQGLIMISGAVLRLVRPASPARILTLFNVTLQMLQFLLASRARADAAIAELARQRAGRCADTNPDDG